VYNITVLKLIKGYSVEKVAVNDTKTFAKINLKLPYDSRPASGDPVAGYYTMTCTDENDKSYTSEPIKTTNTPF
jgi:hypothetical protein